MINYKKTLFQQSKERLNGCVLRVIISNDNLSK